MPVEQRDGQAEQRRAEQSAASPRREPVTVGAQRSDEGQQASAPASEQRGSGSQQEGSRGTSGWGSRPAAAPSRDGFGDDLDVPDFLK